MIAEGDLKERAAQGPSHAQQALAQAPAGAKVTAVGKSGTAKNLFPAATPNPTPTPRPNYPPYGAAYTAGKLPGSLKVNQIVFVPVRVLNASSQTWSKNGDVFHLSYHWYKGGAVVVFDGERTLLVKDVKPGETADLSARVKLPSAPGTYRLKWDMVHEGVSWFSEKGVALGDQGADTSVAP